VQITSEVVLGPDNRPRWKPGGMSQVFTGGQLWWSRHDPEFNSGGLDTTRSSRSCSIREAGMTPRAPWARGPGWIASARGAGSRSASTEEVRGSIMPPRSTSRREFLQATVVAGTLAGVPDLHTAGSDLLRVGLVGCGDRGTGAATQALAADPPYPARRHGRCLQRIGCSRAWPT